MLTIVSEVRVKGGTHPKNHAVLDTHEAPAPVRLDHLSRE